MGIKRIEKIRNEDIRARAGVANISEEIRETRLRWLGHMERKTEEDVVMGTWKMVDKSGHRHERRPKLRWSRVLRKDNNEKGVSTTGRRSTRLESVEIENSMRLHQLGIEPLSERNNYYLRYRYSRLTRIKWYTILRLHS